MQPTRYRVVIKSTTKEEGRERLTVKLSSGVYRDVVLANIEAFCQRQLNANYEYSKASVREQ